MKTTKIKLLQDAAASPDGVNTVVYKKGDKAEVSAPVLNMLVAQGACLDPDLSEKDAKAKRVELLEEREQAKQTRIKRQSGKSKDEKQVVAERTKLAGERADFEAEKVDFEAEKEELAKEREAFEAEKADFEIEKAGKGKGAGKGK